MRPTASAAWLKGGVLFFGKIETKDIIRGGISMKNIYSSLLAIGALVVFTSAFAVRPAEAINLQSWDKQINNPSRFKVFNQFNGIGEAVLDNETGLVWEQFPSTTPRTWFQAFEDCYKKVAGGRVGRRMGWRLPAVEELASLVDPNRGNPALPNGNPFDLPPPPKKDNFYWSANTIADTTFAAWIVKIDTGGLAGAGKGTNAFVWCVRGGQGHDGF